MSNRFKFPDGVKEKLKGSRKKDRADQVCRLAGSRSESRSDKYYSHILLGLTGRALDKIMNFKPKKRRSN